MQRPVDLTPFGFTPTESRVYVALLELGPSTAYAIAKQLGIARANGYQALDGLVIKGAASMTRDPARLYRAVGVTALLGILEQRQTRAIQALETALADLTAHDTPVIAQFVGERELLSLILRLMTRTKA